MEMEKNFLKNFKKILDKLIQMCYNNYRKQERCSLVERIPPSVPPHPFEPHRRQKFFKKFQKKY